MSILDEINRERENITITLDSSLVAKLKDLRKKKKLKRLSPLINALLLRWVEEEFKEKEENE